MKEIELKKIQRNCEKIYSTYGSCKNHPEILYTKIEPKSFSFNSPYGACEKCLGLGNIIDFDIDLIIPNKELCISDGAIKIWKHKAEITWLLRELRGFFHNYKIDLLTPIKNFSNKSFNEFLYGNLDLGWEGLIIKYRRLHRQTDSNYRRDHFEKFMKAIKCDKCLGKRLKDEILGIKINNMNIIQITNLNISECLNFFENLPKKLDKTQNFIAKQILKEINDRLNFLNNVGLSYLNLSRTSSTLSGGEAQRIRLATQIGANLVGVLYILDEPSIGLHQKDNMKLIKTLLKLRDLGNSLIIVEHDGDTMKNADFIVEIGPGAGVKGGHIVASGSCKDIIENKNSITGKYLSGEKKIEVPKIRRKVVL